MDRRLTAILYADIAGYSKLTGVDEAQTHTKLAAALDLVSAVISENSGQKLHEAGDAVLAEFNSATKAVTAAIEIQKRMSIQNADLAESERLQFRIGVNLGEVIDDRDEIYGDGVNLAARIQELSQPGGVCISGAVYDQIVGRVDQNFVDMGHRKFKNISQTVQVYQAQITNLQLPESEVSGFFTKVRKPVATGGCLCRRVRFEVFQQPLQIGYCHCRWCQLATGGALGVSLIFEKEAVRFSGDELKKYKSSEIAERGFCGNCGTSITNTHYTPVESAYYAIRLGSMDNPKDFPPTFHWGVENRLPWLDINDELPRIRSDQDAEIQARWKAVGRPDLEDQLP